jgi:phenylalanyl-tRNA synthetase alpha chain
MGTYSFEQISAIADELIAQAKSDASFSITKALKPLYSQIPNIPPEKRGSYGKEVNELKAELESFQSVSLAGVQVKTPIDVTAPWSPNTPPSQRPSVLAVSQGSIHPLMQEIQIILDIYYRMGFTAVESRQIDDDYHMFESLNFPHGHPARDDFDTFMTDEGLIAPAHTSTMQNRVLRRFKDNLAAGDPIAVVIPGRVFRNEDVDVTHEHTFYQLEGVFVGKNIHVGNLIAVLQAFMSEYFGQTLKAKIQPFYFPFTEPSFEFAIERPESLRRGDTEADLWLELLGCGMIHPNVLRAADIDPETYTGFAWGGGIERLVLMKYGIEDIRHFESGKIEFLRQFA